MTIPGVAYALIAGVDEKEETAIIMANPQEFIFPDNLSGVNNVMTDPDDVDLSQLPKPQIGTNPSTRTKFEGQGQVDVGILDAFLNPMPNEVSISNPINGSRYNPNYKPTLGEELASAVSPVAVLRHWDEVDRLLKFRQSDKALADRLEFEATGKNVSDVDLILKEAVSSFKFGVIVICIVLIINLFLSFLPGFWNWFGFIFILGPLVVLGSTLGLLLLFLPFLPVALIISFLGSLFGDNYANFLAPFCAIIFALYVYTKTNIGRKWLNWILDTFNPENSVKDIASFFKIDF